MPDYWLITMTANGFARPTKVERLAQVDQAFK